jgi:hypothetical protein
MLFIGCGASLSSTADIIRIVYATSIVQHRDLFGSALKKEIFGGKWGNRGTVSEWGDAGSFSHQNIIIKRHLQVLGRSPEFQFVRMLRSD